MAQDTLTNLQTRINEGKSENKPGKNTKTRVFQLMLDILDTLKGWLSKLNFDIDANGKRITGLLLPTGATEPVRKGEFDSLDNMTKILENVIHPNLLPHLDLITSPSAGATVSGNKLVIPAGSTGFDSRVVCVIPPEIRNIRFSIVATGQIPSNGIYVSKANWVNGMLIAAANMVLKSDGTYGITIDYTLAGTEEYWIFWHRGSQDIIAKTTEIYFNSVCNYDPNLISETRTDVTELRRITEYKETKYSIFGYGAAGSIFNGTEITIPISSTGFDSRLGVIISEDRFVVKFKVPKGDVTMFYFSSSTYVGLIEINHANVSSVINTDGTYTYTVVGDRPTDLTEYMISLQYLSTVAAMSEEQLSIISYEGHTQWVIADSIKVLNDELNRTSASATIGIRVNGEILGGKTGVAAWKDTASLFDGMISNIRFLSSNAGTAKFFFGKIDQWGKAVFRKEFSLSVILGENVLVVNDMIFKDEYIFVSESENLLKYQINWIATATEMMYSETLEGPLGRLATTYGGSLSFDFDIKYDKTGYATKTEVIPMSLLLGDIAAKVNSPLKLESSGGTVYKLKVTSDGTLYTTSNKYKNVLCLGNSITIHGLLADRWWNICGMAASRKIYDWVHVLGDRIKVYEPTSTISAQNIADFELSLDSYDLTQLDQYLVVGIDLVCLRIGENVVDASGDLELRFGRLIDHIKTQLPMCEIVVGGLFWTNDARDLQMKAACDIRKIQFVKMSQLDSDPSNKATIGTIVYDEAGVQHLIADQGVANHPCDVGMAAIADLFANAIGV